jgi:hypothetical protein
MGLWIWLVETEKAEADVKKVDGRWEVIGTPRTSTIDRGWSIPCWYNKAWGEAGCSDALYESHNKKAQETIPALRQALSVMRSEMGKYKDLLGQKGYDLALEFLEQHLRDCESSPTAIIKVAK